MAAEPPRRPGESVGALVARATSSLQVAGSTSARLDAELLLAEALGKSRVWLLAHATDSVAADVVAAFDALVTRRSALEPIAYILGRQAFRNIELAVDQRVLIPRPETELSVAAVLEAVVEICERGGSPAQVVDVGTGSGAIALAVLDEAPAGSVRVTATDASDAALEVARENARRLGNEHDLTLLVGDLLAPLADGGALDIVVSNLPYVAPEDAPTLMADVVDWEPGIALFGPAGDAAGLIRRLVDQARAQLRPGGSLILEVGAGQADAVLTMLTAAGFEDAHAVPDLQGIPRCVVGRQPAVH